MKKKILIAGSFFNNDDETEVELMEIGEIVILNENEEISDELCERLINKYGGYFIFTNQVIYWDVKAKKEFNETMLANRLKTV